jgi:hypothetical protein
MDYEIQQAKSRREEVKAALLCPDGSRYFSDEAHKEQERAIDREFATTMDRIQAGIEVRAERARGELAALETADPASSLSTDELQRAAAMSVFVGEEVADLPTQNLVQRVRAAASSGDKAASYALLRHAARQDDDISGEVRNAVAELRGALDPGRERKVAAAKASLEEAEDLQFKAQLARVGANNLGDAYLGGGGSSSYWGAAS